MSETTSNIDAVSNGIAKVVAEVNKLDTDKAIKFTTAMDSVTAVTNAVSGEASAGSAAGTPGMGASKAGQPITIILKLKNKVLAKETGKIVNGMFATDTDTSFA